MILISNLLPKCKGIKQHADQILFPNLFPHANVHYYKNMGFLLLASWGEITITHTIAKVTIIWFFHVLKL
jgi:hypothetical protein